MTLDEFDCFPRDAVAREAAAKGFTRDVICDSAEVTLEGWIKPDADLDGTFKLIDGDTGEVLKVNGWLFDRIENAS